MGFALSGGCYDAAGIPDALMRQFPVFRADGVESFQAMTVLNADGWMAYWTILQKLDGTFTTVQHSVLLGSCTESLSQWPVQSILFYLALAFALFAGFKTGFRP